MVFKDLFYSSKLSFMCTKLFIVFSYYPFNICGIYSDIFFFTPNILIITIFSHFAKCLSILLIFSKTGFWCDWFFLYCFSIFNFINFFYFFFLHSACLNLDSFYVVTFWPPSSISPTPHFWQPPTCLCYLYLCASFFFFLRFHI